MQGSDVWNLQPNEAGHVLARAHARRGLAGRERLISVEISTPLWSLLLQAEERGWPLLWRPRAGVIADRVPDKRTVPAGHLQPQQSGEQLAATLQRC